MVEPNRDNFNEFIMEHLKDKSTAFINLPVSLALTGEGLSLFANNPNVLKKFKNKDGSYRQGMQSESYNSVSVQKLIMNSFVEEIFISLPDFLRKRKEIIDTNNLVLYGILYKKLSPSLASMLFESHVLKDYNRKNPKALITSLNHIDKSKMEALRAAKKQLFETMEIEINSEVVQRIISSPDLEEEDRLTRMRSLEKFMAYIDKRIWYLYFIIYQTSLKDEIKKSFADMIALYLDRTKLAAHLSNLLMEFIQNAEKAHLERIIISHNMATKSEIDKYLKNSENRKWVIEEAKRKNQMLELSWNMNSERSGVGNTYKLQIAISNYGLIDEKTRASLATKMKSDASEISVANFYQDSGDADKLGAGLGLLYISYLEDICKKEGIKFFCTIFPEPSKEKTTVKIEIGL